MNADGKITLDSLAERANASPAYRRAAMSHKACDTGMSCRHWVYLVILFLVIVLLLAVTRPRFVRKCCDDDRSKDCRRDDDRCEDYFRDINWGKLLLWALVITVIIAVIVYALKCCGCFDGCGSSCSL